MRAQVQILLVSIVLLVLFSSLSKTLPVPRDGSNNSTYNIQTPPQRREAYVESRVTSFLELVKLLTLPSDWQNL
jgi:hypothetical protein